MKSFPCTWLETDEQECAFVVQSWLCPFRIDLMYSNRVGPSDLNPVFSSWDMLNDETIVFLSLNSGTAILAFLLFSSLPALEFAFYCQLIRPFFSNSFEHAFLCSSLFMHSFTSILMSFPSGFRGTLLSFCTWIPFDLVTNVLEMLDPWILDPNVFFQRMCECNVWRRESLQIVN